MEKDELLKLANAIAEKAENDSKTQEIEHVIAKIKAEILIKINEQIAALVMAEGLELLTKKKSDPFFVMPARPTFGGSVSYEIAECAEIIMRRAWLEKR